MITKTVRPEEIENLTIKAIEFDTGLKSQFSVFFSYGDDPTTAVVTKIMYYQACNGKWTGFAETTGVNDYYIMILASTKLEEMVKKMANAFMYQFKKGKVTIDGDEDNISKYIADAISDGSYGWY